MPNYLVASEGCYAVSKLLTLVMKAIDDGFLNRNKYFNIEEKIYSSIKFFIISVSVGSAFLFICNLFCTMEIFIERLSESCGHDLKQSKMVK